MKLYAVRDRLIDYFMQPFVADSTPKVLAAMAETINDTGNRHAIAQTPHHFELWQLAEINEETGHVTGKPEFVAECTSLVRRSDGQGRDARADALQSPNGGRGTEAGQIPGRAATDQRAPQGASQAEDSQGARPTAQPG